MLHVVTLAYHGRPAPALYGSATAAQRQAHLWAAYVARMFEQRPLTRNCGYTDERAIVWLSQLARMLHNRDQTEFNLDRLAPEWLGPPAEQERVRLLISAIGGLAAGLVAGFTFILVAKAYNWNFGAVAALAAGSISGLACGLLGALVIGLSGGLTISVQSGERVSWSWSKLYSGILLILRGGPGTAYLPGQKPAPNAQAATVFGLAAALVAGLISVQIAGIAAGIFAAIFAGLGCGLAWGLVGAVAGGLLNIEPVEQIRWSWSKLRTGLPAALAAGLIGGAIFGLAAAMLGGVSSAEAAAPASAFALAWTGMLIAGISAALRNERAFPNEGIRRSARYSVSMGVFLGLSAILFFGLPSGMVSGFRQGLYAGLGCGTAFGVASALMFGGAACIQHYVLRGWLVRQSIAPWRYGLFLDSMASRLLLRRSGSAFLFVHRLLRDYLAEAK